MGSNEVAWLDDREQRAWRSYLRAHSELQAELHRRLLAATGLSLADYEVLVTLSESTGGRLRISELARSMHWERSRVSHQVTRMAGRGLVERDDCDTDRRGAFAVLTDEGLQTLQRAAGSHVDDVRSLFIEPVGADLDPLAQACDRIVEQLADRE